MEHIKPINNYVVLTPEGKLIGFKDKDNYYINAHSKCTSTVIDMGFITNVSDLKKVTTDKTKTAQAIADGIKDYLKQAGLY